MTASVAAMAATNSSAGACGGRIASRVASRSARGVDSDHPVSQPHVSASHGDPALAAALERAAVPYREHGWPADEAQDRAWIRALEPLLAKHGATLATELERVFRSHLVRPVRVDVSAFAGPVGAYTVIEPTQVTISSTDSPFARSAIKRPPICAGVAPPSMIWPITSAISARDRCWPASARLIAGTITAALRAHATGAGPQARG